MTMGTTTKIEWAHHTWSPWRGCQHATLADGTSHPGCDHCYAETMSKRNPTVLGTWGPDGTRVVAAEKSWEQVRRWNAAAAKAGERRRIFPSLCDPFEDWDGQMKCVNGQWAVRTRKWGDPIGFAGCTLRGGNDALKMADVRRDLFFLSNETPNLDWLLLTKRPQNVRRMTPVDYFDDGEDCDDDDERDFCADGDVRERRENVHLLYSASDQATLESGIDDLLACRDLVATVGLSLEPLLGPVMLSPYIGADGQAFITQGIDCDWIIVGGESGPHARPCDVEWIRSIVQQCAAAGVPCYVKQLGSVIRGGLTIGDEHGWTMVGHRAGGGWIDWKPTDRKGGDPDEWPEDLRVRQFPESMP